MGNSRKKGPEPAAKPKSRLSEPKVRPSERKKLAPDDKKKDDRITVVGIGASAGGLQALQAFFEALPKKTGLAFVVVTHLHPDHESHLAELIQTRTPMPVRQVTSRTQIVPDHVYVIPPNHNILVTDSHLDVSKFNEPHGHRTPVDDFFRSLAREHNNPVAVILSGSGTDGAVGIKDVKEAGGLLMVQDPRDAEYDGMPAAAVATGVVDAVLPVRELAQKLLEFVRSKPRIPFSEHDLSDKDHDIVKRILAQVHARTGHDFSQYKTSTILRRIQRRMQLNGIETLDEYLAYLRSNGAEASLMFNDILIGVTNFFRDRTPWDALAREVIPALFRGKSEGESIRVWSVGCATGEEAFSIAMLLQEYADKQDRHHDMLVIASDLDEASLSLARAATYPTAIEVDVSRERLEKFFTQRGFHYQVKRELRDIVLFANHSIMRDPPFSHIDLIVCRNVLIYLQRELQDNLFDSFHYALKPGGFMFLGASESAESVTDLFQPVDKSHRIYSAKPWTGETPHVPVIPLRIRHPARRERFHPPERLSFQRSSERSVEELHRASLEQFGPPTVLVGEDYNVVHVSESAGRFFTLPKGAVTADVLKLVRPELQMELRSALFQAFEKGRAVLTHPVPMRFDGQPHNVAVFVRPRAPRAASPLAEREALVVFLEDEFERLEGDKSTGVMPSGEREDAMVLQLEAEVTRLREQLQATIEEFDSSNEEMKAGNEELQSINEEYRSATEELETSKEELQSVNEELQAVNYELKGKLDEISRAHSDLENLMAASEIATLFLDRDLRIVRSTPTIAEIFNIMGSDRGRSITDLAHNLVYRELASDAERVLRELIMVEREVRGPDGRWFLIRQRPYRTADFKIDGVVITFMDISRLKKAEQSAVELSETLEHRVGDRTRDLAEANQKILETRDMFFMLFNSNPIPTVLLRREDGRFLNVNPAFLNLFQIRRDAVIDHRPRELDFNIPALTKSNTKALVEQLDEEGSITDFETEVVWRGDELTVLAHFQRVMVDNTPAVLIAFSDITVRKRVEQRLRDVIDATPDAMVVIGEDGRVALVNPQAEKLFGYSREQLIRKPMLALFSARYDGSHAVNRKDFFKLGEKADRRLSLFAARSDGTEFPVEVTFSPLITDEGQLVITAIRDVSERVKAEQQIRGLALNLTTAEQQERHRISQVLHDDLQQRLFAIKTHLSFMEVGLRKVEAQQLHDEFNKLASQLDEAISVTRNLSADMSPVVLQGEGLPDALMWLAQQMQERYGLQVAVRNGVAAFALEKSLRVILFQAVREVLFNVAKHAGTSEATVSMHQLDGIMRITVEDRGKGFDALHMPSGSTLLGIKRRLSLLGCQMTVESTPGKGTLVHIDVKTEPAEGAA